MSSADTAIILVSRNVTTDLRDPHPGISPENRGQPEGRFVDWKPRPYKGRKIILSLDFQTPLGYAGMSMSFRQRKPWEAPILDLAKNSVAIARNSRQPPTCLLTERKAWSSSPYASFLTPNNTEFMWTQCRRTVGGVQEAGG